MGLGGRSMIVPNLHLEKTQTWKNPGKNPKNPKKPGFFGFFKILGFCPTLPAGLVVPRPSLRPLLSSGKTKDLEKTFFFLDNLFWRYPSRHHPAFLFRGHLKYLVLKNIWALTFSESLRLYTYIEHTEYWVYCSY